MAAKKAKRSALESVLDAPQDGREWLRVRNITNGMLVIPCTNGEAKDIVLLPFEEVAPKGAAWLTSRPLRSMEKAERIELEWVDQRFMPRELPNLDAAPPDARPEKSVDKNMSIQIALQDDARALELIAINVFQPGAEATDVKFMKTRMEPVLKLAVWLEPQYRNRRQVNAALKRRLEEIRVL
jgi:hypothetical protein